MQKRITLLNHASFGQWLLGLMVLAVYYRVILYYGLKAQPIPPLSFNPSISLPDFLGLCRIDFLVVLLIALLWLPVLISCKGRYLSVLQYVFLFALTVLSMTYLTVVTNFGISPTFNILATSLSQLNAREIFAFTPVYIWGALFIPVMLFFLINRIRSHSVVWFLVALLFGLSLRSPSQAFTNNRFITPAISLSPGCFIIYDYLHNPLPKDSFHGTPVAINGLRYTGKLFEYSASSTIPLTIKPESKIPSHVILFIIESFRANDWSQPLDEKGTIAMPFLKQLSRQSVVLEHHYSTSNNSFPSLFSISTGLYPPAGNMDLILMNSIRIPTIASFMNRKDSTALDTLWVTPGRENFYFPAALIRHSGFELIGQSGLPAYDREDKCPAARNEFSAFDYFQQRLLRQQSSSQRTLNVYETFVGHFFYDDYGPEFRAVPNPHNFHDRYLNNLRVADVLLQHLYETINSDPNRLNNTILIVTGDHGESFGEKGFMGHGNNSFESNLRVPCLIYAPGILPPSVISTPTTHADLLPSILNLLHEPYDPNQFQGESLLHPLRRKYIFNAGYEGSISAISHDLIKTIWQPGDHRLVYDLRVDPLEAHPLKPEPYNEQFNAMFSFYRTQNKLLLNYQRHLTDSSGF